MVNSAQCTRGWPGRFLCSLRYACAVWKVDMCSRESACLKIWPRYAIRDEIICWDGESNLGAYS